MANCSELSDDDDGFAPGTTDELWSENCFSITCTNTNYFHV